VPTISFGKPVDAAEITIKASAMDVAVNEVASAQGKTDADGAYHFDLHLPKYFAGLPSARCSPRPNQATVKDQPAIPNPRRTHQRQRIPLLITAIPEGGSLVPHLENQIFILTSYADGTPAKASVVVRAAGNAEQHVSTDDGALALTRITPAEKKPEQRHTGNRSHRPGGSHVSPKSTSSLAMAKTKSSSVPSAPSIALESAFNSKSSPPKPAVHLCRYRERRPNHPHPRSRTGKTARPNSP